MGERELGFEIELQVDILAAVLRLPPATKPVARLSAHNVVHRVAIDIGAGIEGLTRIAYKTLGRILGLSKDAIAFGLLEATC